MIHKLKNIQLDSGCSPSSSFNHDKGIGQQHPKNVITSPAWMAVTITTTTTTTTITWFHSAGKRDSGSPSLVIAHPLSTLTLNTFGRPHTTITASSYYPSSSST